ncbi:MAG: hypothetical protein A2W99_03240 [Bacteroidetes bacterium GWF2_33_16]|nr:MAG: hypothetical protein A2X00_11830 [Bacteroidetes bacterium GWE2_32_14]OFY08206.1 MAG: hypothetical protein A2W99_03240 [Bacteroidetes bacterium GWF2_33_16]
MSQGWEIKKLGEVTEILNGGTPKTNIAEYWDGEIHWITPSDLGKLTKPTVDYTTRKITSLGLEKSSAKIFPENSVILSTRAPIGHLAINEVPMSTNQGCRGIVPSKKIDTWFLYYFLKKNVEFLDSLGTGTTFKELSTKSLAGVEILLPPLPEQQRIVTILEKTFAAIDQAKVNAKQNLKNAKELFESYLQGVFEKKGEGWEEQSLGKVYDVRDGTHDSPKYQEQGFPLITSKNLKKDLLNYDNVNYISELDYININKRSKVDKGDILFAMIGTIGNPVVIQDEPDFAIKNVALFKVPKGQDSYFLKYYLDSKPTIDKMISDAKGTTQKFVGLGYLRGFKILIPPLSEQQIIVKKLDLLSAETKRLEAIYKQKINNLEELKKSILQKAFSGEL